MSVVVFGGSFNPIHYGHLVLADEALEALGADRVLFVPNAAPPHKPVEALAPAPDRYAMVALAVAGNPRFAVSDLELSRPGPSYTVDTLEALQATERDLHLLIGSETFLDLLTWRTPRRVAALARLVVVPRVGSAFDAEGEAAQKVLREIGARRFVHLPGGTAGEGSVLIVHATSLPVSASDLRRRAREGRSLAYRLPEPVIAYIRDRGLYGSAAR
ncbi:MAG: nicotinate (nicotinamide) nucleotide adenylyltransferase [Candidatus Rokubacteria bacterium]|nr:nicotinate (nicotinamide) nucleotide adenylyltransferase [Candidatus Rokubacteria bacterium]MBI3824710.1 nicotinate (nicotinamide) nucleotide adenylyltransferase [Candidatus Rokubacteria bacterium]